MHTCWEQHLTTIPRTHHSLQIWLPRTKTPINHRSIHQLTHTHLNSVTNNSHTCMDSHTNQSLCSVCSLFSYHPLPSLPFSLSLFWFSPFCSLSSFVYADCTSSDLCLFSDCLFVTCFGSIFKLDK